MLQQLLPSAQRFEEVSDAVYAGYQGERIIGYVTTGDFIGYGGLAGGGSGRQPAGHGLRFRHHR